ncbi:hypothetical protein NDU88_004123 [Pleurodeles waltl]|uniref:Uncharacterized protein n=1 Tax=Pleurodeles waltl TaxID=8319 RepID=A0AAV7TRJ8_PLEWA|nr:hypothetical protein NDU88_004123 [Pleurodeles waltl]
MKTGRARERRGKIPVTGEVVLSRRFVCSKNKRRTTGPQGDEHHLCKLAIGFNKVVISIKDNNISTFVGLFYDDITVGSQMFYRRYLITLNIGRFPGDNALLRLTNSLVALSECSLRNHLLTQLQMKEEYHDWFVYPKRDLSP